MLLPQQKKEFKKQKNKRTNNRLLNEQKRINQQNTRK